MHFEHISPKIIIHFAKILQKLLACRLTIVSFAHSLRGSLTSYSKMYLMWKACPLLINEEPSSLFPIVCCFHEYCFQPSLPVTLWGRLFLSQIHPVRHHGVSFVSVLPDSLYPGNWARRPCRESSKPGLCTCSMESRQSEITRLHSPYLLVCPC